MIEKAYPVSFEVEGPAAMFTRPDTGSSPVSYPAPTKSALKSMFVWRSQKKLILSRSVWKFVSPSCFTSIQPTTVAHSEKAEQ